MTVRHFDSKYIQEHKYLPRNDSKGLQNKMPNLDEITLGLLLAT